AGNLGRLTLVRVRRVEQVGRLAEAGRSCEAVGAAVDVRVVVRVDDVGTGGVHRRSPMVDATIVDVEVPGIPCIRALEHSDVNRVGTDGIEGEMANEAVACGMIR